MPFLYSNFSKILKNSNKKIENSFDFFLYFFDPFSSKTVSWVCFLL